MSTYDDMVNALREKKRDEDEQKAHESAQAAAAATKRRAVIAALMERVHPMFFSAQQNDFEGLELLHSGSYYSLKSFIYDFTVNGDRDNEVVIATDVRVSGKVVKLIPNASPPGFFIEGEGPPVPVDETFQLIVKEMLGWVQTHRIKVTG